MRLPLFGRTRDIQIFVDISAGEIWVIVATLLALAGVGTVMILKVRLRWLWAGLLAAAPLAVGVLAWQLKAAQINEYIDSDDLSLSPDYLEWELGHVKRPVYWGLFGTPAALGMAVVCHLSVRTPRKMSLTPSVPPALPGTQTDWPEIGS